MPYICKDCKLIFDKKKTNCPFCGGKIYLDNNSNESLLSNKYSWAPGCTPKSNKNIDTLSESNNIQSNKNSNTITDLKQSYFNQYNNNDNSSNSTSNLTNRKNGKTLDDTLNSTLPSKTETSDLNNRVNNTNNINYFQQHTSNNISDPIPTINPLDPNSTLNSNITLEPNSNSNVSSSHYIEIIHNIFHNIIHLFVNLIENINFRFLLRLLAIIFIVLVVIYLWNMRYVIYNSILQFVSSLISFGILILVLWFCFLRNIFR